MKKRFGWIAKKLVKFSATALPVLAMVVAVSPCFTRLYEPELPEQLKD